jgi:hypothetical protein
MRLHGIACALVLLSATARATDAPVLPSDAWYRVEVIIFERIADVDPNSAQETLVLHAPRVYPLDVLAFDDDASRDAAYPLDAETRAQPALPTAVASTPNRSVQAPPASQLPAAPPTAAERAAQAIADYQTQLQDRSYRFEPASSFLLAQEDARLQRSNVYRVAFHRAWIQPVPDRDRLQPMLIEIGERADGLPRIEGILGVTRGRYLHLDTRLWYAVDPDPAASVVADPAGVSSRYVVGEIGTAKSAVPPMAADTPGYMELREQRRMRSGELHYLDHPKFGVLARVDPIQPPEALLAELARLRAPQQAPAATPLP